MDGRQDGGGRMVGGREDSHQENGGFIDLLCNRKSRAKGQRFFIKSIDKLFAQ